MKKLLIFSAVFLSVNGFASVQDFENHMEMAHNKNLNMNSRWTSLIRSTNYANVKQVEEIRKFTKDQDWYMRNAALVALNKIDQQLAIEEARKLIKDKALVVRSAAVEIIAQDLNEDNKRILISELDQGYNYNRKKGLWIRRQILEKLAPIAQISERDIYLKALFESDKRMSETAAYVLEKITGVKLEKKKFVQGWREYAKSNNWNTSL